MKESRGMTFAAGFITCFVILLGIKFFFGGGDINSERILQLQRDSAKYANKVRVRDSLYMDLWVQYAHKDDSLTLALDDLATARRRRPPSRIADNDSLRAAILRELYQR